MPRMSRVAPLLALALSVAGALWAQEQRKSPHESTSATIAGKKVTIEYGRPYKKGRQIYGGLVPYGEVWRTGADEATKLTTEADLMIGDIHVPQGSYSLFTIPNENEWTLILNKAAEQWGAFNYDKSQDLGRTAMKVSRLDSPLEQLTIEIEPAGGNNATLKLSWDQTVASVGIMVH